MLFNKYLFKYYLRYSLFFLIGIAALVAIDFTQLKIAEYVRDIVNLFTDAELNGVVIESEVMDIFWKLILVAAIIFAGRILWRYAIFYASHKIESKIREDMFLKAEKLSINYYYEAKVGNVMSWFTNDLDTVQEFLGWGTVSMVDAFFLTIMTTIKMVTLSWQLSLIAAAPILLIAVWGFIVEKMISDKWDIRQKTYDELYDFAQENFTGIRVIKAFVKENQEIHAFSKVARKNQKVNINFGRASVLVDVVIEIIIGTIICLIFGFGSWFILQYTSGNPVVIFNTEVKLSVGELSQYLVYFDTLIWPMIAIGQVISMHSRARTSLKRITRYLNAEEEISNCENPIILENVKGEIRFNNLTFKYSEEKEPVLRDISFTIKPGERIGIVGKIGSGKTSITNLLLRLYNVDKNTIFIDGNDIMECDIASLRAAIAYVPQDNFLFSDTLENNISFSEEKLDTNRVVEAAKFADVHNDIKDFKDGYQTMIGERGVTLSGGQKQRVSLARAYLKSAPILILDDSVSAVDSKTEETIFANLKNCHQEQTIVVIASRISTVSHLDRILVLNEGKLEAFDTPTNLLKISETYRKMVSLQELEAEMEGGD